jgi:glyoxylase-like metal-dependent hydrolase (beta-lactamase superfamily II)
MVNLEHPKAIAAGLEDRDEPIEMYFHVLRHPTRGMFIIDTGVERAQRDDPDKALFRGLLASVMNVEAMKVQMPLGDWLKQQPDPLAGVFLTHLHLDHIAGMRDVPARTPIYSGPGETKASKLENMFVQGVVDEALEGKAALREWKYSADSDGRFAGLVDIFGDGSLWAIWVPGHTPGSTAYLAHTTDGPVLYTGDASHTAWGWEHGVEPGEFTADREENAIHLAKLKALVDEFPQIQVRLGHQELVAKSSTIASSF